MAVQCPLSERDWLYYMVFTDLAMATHGSTAWTDAEPHLAAAWRRYGDATRWQDVSGMLRSLWPRASAAPRSRLH